VLKNYIKIAFRNITRHKKFTAINVLGLALGMTCCMFIFLWVMDEKSIDNFHVNGQKIYSVYENTESNGQISSSYTTPILYNFANRNKYFEYPLEKSVASIPGIKHLVFYATGYDLPWGHPETIQVGEKIIKLNGARTGKDFFTVFSYPIIEGSKETALSDMYHVALSRHAAELFFGDAKKAIGKTVRYENKYDFVVSAVFENITAKSSLQFDFLLNWDAQSRILEWSSNDFKNFIELSSTADVGKITAAINQQLLARMDKKPGVHYSFGLQPAGDRYLYGQFENGKPAGGRIEYVRIFSGVAIFILIIACINFMNLATARSVKRAKEVGLRKVVGSSRAALIYQFFCEAIAYAFISMILSVILFYLFLPAFNAFAGKQIASPVFNPGFWISIVGLVIITGLVAGSYPALYLSGLQPVRVLKGVMRFSFLSILFRKGLTVFQFVLSIFLIITTIVIYRQINFTQHAHLGFDRENMIYVQMEGELSKPENYLRFKQEVSNMPGIAMVDRSTEVPHAMDFIVADAINWEGKEKNASVGFKPSSVGFDFIRIMGMEIKDGRDFSRAHATDSADAFMVNEEAVREMGLKNPIGKWISAWNKKGHIIAVLKDYHTQSLREPIKPVVMDVKEYEYFGVIIVKTVSGKTTEALESLSKVYKEINPRFAFAYQFADLEYAKLYSSEMLISKLTILFAALAIGISCMGLLGLVMFSAEQRMKEISVRKVLGASLSQIMSLFSKDFLQLILIAFLVASPLAWYAMFSWLKGFAYKIDISWWMFAVAGLFAVMIALLTISYQSLKSALTNPVTSLRSE
jgi:putative ABC transport system permease protein